MRLLREARVMRNVFAQTTTECSPESCVDPNLYFTQVDWTFTEPCSAIDANRVRRVAAKPLFEARTLSTTIPALNVDWMPIHTAFPYRL